MSDWEKEWEENDNNNNDNNKKNNGKRKKQIDIKVLTTQAQRQDGRAKARFKKQLCDTILHLILGFTVYNV